MPVYIISRHGKHPVNQPDREIAILGTVEAAGRLQALAAAAAAEDPAWRCEERQYLRASLWKGASGAPARP